jgi:PiT family inorganic phosphate transporter
MEVCTRPDPATVVSVRGSKLVDAAHFLSAGVVSFARGLNDTPKIAAPLVLLHWLAPASRMSVVAVAIAVGGLLGARRVAETMSHKITRMDPGQGLASNLTTSALVILASTFGLPVSTTHVSVGSLFGVGLVTGGANARTAMSIVLSWVVTLPCAACIGGLAYLVAETLR